MTNANLSDVSRLSAQRLKVAMGVDDRESLPVFPVDANNRAKLTCPSCGTVRAVDVSRVADKNKPLRLKCTCGNVFSGLLGFKDAVASSAGGNGVVQTQTQAKTRGKAPAQASPQEAAKSLKVVPITVDAQNRAKMVCPVCGASKVFDASKIKDPTKHVRVKCSCAHIFAGKRVAAKGGAAVVSTSVAPTAPAVPLVPAQAPKEAKPLPSVPVDPANRARITCPECAETKILDVTRLKGTGKPLRYVCDCGNSFARRLIFAKPELPKENGGASAQNGPANYMGSLLPAFLSQDGYWVKVVCPSCSESQEIDVSTLKSLSEPIRMKCRCGSVYESVLAPADQLRAASAMDDIPEVGVDDIEALPEVEADIVEVVEAEAVSAPKRWAMRTEEGLDKEDPSVKKIFVGEQKSIMIVCPNCGYVKNIETAKFFSVQQPLHIDCVCGNVHFVNVEFRSAYRKVVSLPGSYVNNRTSRKNNMVVRDISLGGVGIQVPVDHDIQMGDTVEVTFMLDNGKASVIRRVIEVKSIRKARYVGGKFYHKHERDPDLGYYLLR